MGRDADTTAAVAGALAGATRGASAIPPEWAAAIGPARGSCLPSMAGHHVLDVAELLVPGEDGKWGEGVVAADVVPILMSPGRLPTRTRRPSPGAATTRPRDALAATSATANAARRPPMTPPAPGTTRR